MTEASTYVAEFLKANDRDRYISTLLLTGPKRDAVQALYGFAADVAAIPSRVTEPAPGEIRLQWWVDALEGKAHGGIQQNPMAAALFTAVEDYNLVPGPLVRLVAARRFDLYQDPMPDMETFEGYAGETSSVLYQYAATILNEGIVPADGDAAGHLGVAHALIGHIRALGFNAARGRIFLPWAFFAANGVNEQQLFAGQETDGICETIQQLTTVAAEHLTKAKGAIENSPRPSRLAFAMVALLEFQLKSISKTKSYTQPAQEISDWSNILRLIYWSIIKG